LPVPRRCARYALPLRLRESLHGWMLRLGIGDGLLIPSLGLIALLGRSVPSRGTGHKPGQPPFGVSPCCQRVRGGVVEVGHAGTQVHPPGAGEYAPICNHHSVVSASRPELNSRLRIAARPAS